MKQFNTSAELVASVNDPQLTKKQLQSLLTKYDNSVVALSIRNENISPKVLETCWELFEENHISDTSFTMRYMLAAHRNTPQKILAELYGSYPGCATNLACNPNTPEEILDDLARQSLTNSSILFNLVGNDSATEKQLDYIARNCTIGDVVAVALLNSKTSTETVSALLPSVLRNFSALQAEHLLETRENLPEILRNLVRFHIVQQTSNEYQEVNSPAQ